jgi:hypothetical protein
MFFRVRLLALHLIAPWHILLTLNALASLAVITADATKPLMERIKQTKMSADAWPHPHFISAIFPIATIVCACGLFLVGLAKAVLATRSAARAKASLAEERRKKIEGKSDWDRKVEAARLWHGKGQHGLACYKAAKAFGVGQDALKLILDRAFASYNAANPSKSLHGLEDFRSIKCSVFESHLSPAECGRGDRLSEWERTQIKSRYMQRCQNFKDVPESNLTNDSEFDDFAKTINEVFAESRVGCKKKITAEEYSNFAIRKWAREMELVSTGTVPGSDSRSAAVGDWRNMISSIVMWVALTLGFSKPIPPSCMYNMDDTTVFLEQKFGKRSKRTFVSKEVKDDLRSRQLSFSFGVSKSKRDKKRKKRANMQARTVKILFCSCADGTATCTVIKIKDESIQRFQIQKVTDRLYIVWDPKIPKSGSRAPAEPKAVRVQRTAAIMQHAILPAIIADLSMKRQRQNVAVAMFSEDGTQRDSQDSHAADDCLDRALLSMDGDFAQIEAILELSAMVNAFSAANVELFKFAAGASMTQQPNDRSRCFYCLKKALSEQRMKIQQDISLAAALLSPSHKKALRNLDLFVPDKGKSKTSHATFKFFLSSCEAIFSYAFSVPNIRGGWYKCGLAPFNPKQMMVSYAFFKDLEKVAPDATQQVLDAIPKLAAHARDTGFVTDAQMEAELGELFALAPALAATYTRRIEDRAPVNHRRCIWLSNASFLERERELRMERNSAAAAARIVPLRPAAAELQVPANGSQNIPWCFPCKWTGPDGVVVECGSKDKKKSQHVVSAAHLRFIEDVNSLRQAQAHLLLLPADAENGEEDPIDLLRWQNDDLVHDSDSSSDSDSDVTSVFEVTPKATAASPIGCDGSRSRTPTRVHFAACNAGAFASPIGGGGAAPNTGNTALLAPGFSTRSRSHSRTPTRVHFVDDESSAKRQRLQ